jgi:hypothetical protein
MFRRFFVPTMADLFFAALLAAAFARTGGWQDMLADGDTGWHVRTGELILASGRVPAVDPFSFSRAGAPWIAWEWLSDVAFALAARRGLIGAAVLAGVVVCGAATVLFGWLLRRGTGLWIALAVALASVSASSVHYLARPHVFSILLYTVSLWVLDEDRRRPGRRVWLLVGISALWANLHGAFLVLPATLVLAAAVDTARREWRGANGAARCGIRALRRSALPRPLSIRMAGGCMRTSSRTCGPRGFSTTCRSFNRPTSARRACWYSRFCCWQPRRWRREPWRGGNGSRPCWRWCGAWRRFGRLGTFPCSLRLPPR